MKVFFIGIGVLAAITALVVGGFGVQYYTARARGVIGVNEKVNADSNRILFTYEWFFNKWGAVKAYAGQIPLAKGAVDQFKADHAGNLESYANSTELARLNSVLLGLRAQMQSSVQEYNANAANATRSDWRDQSLPVRICITSDTVNPC